MNVHDIHTWARKMAPQLGASTILTEDEGSVSRHHMAAHNHP